MLRTTEAEQGVAKEVAKADEDDESAGLVGRKQLEYEDEGEAVVLAGGGKAGVQGV